MKNNLLLDRLSLPAAGDMFVFSAGGG